MKKQWHAIIVAIIMGALLPFFPPVSFGAKKASDVQTRDPIRKSSDTAMEEQITPVLASFVAPPRPAILSDGRVYVLYELMLSNASNIHFTIDKLEAVDGKPGGGRIAIFDKKAIEGHSKFPGASGPGASLDPGQSGFVRINLSFPSLEEVPRIIGHVLTVSSEKPWGPYPTSTIVERVASIDVPPDTGPTQFPDEPKILILRWLLVSE